MKVNLFERMKAGNCQLMPLFPYEDADSLVPAGAIFRGEPGAEFGQFFHFNTVDEVAHVFGANGALLQTGQIYATQPLHGVNSFLKDPTNPDNFLVIAVTQHQRASGPQNEAVIFVIKPTGWMVPVEAGTMLPRFYYIHQPAGTPAELNMRYRGIDPTGPLRPSQQRRAGRGEQHQGTVDVVPASEGARAVPEVEVTRDDTALLAAQEAVREPRRERQRLLP